MTRVVQLRHLLSRAEKPEERRAHHEACEVRHGRGKAQRTADNQEHVGSPGHVIPSSGDAWVSRAAKRSRMSTQGHLSKPKPRKPLARSLTDDAAKRIFVERLELNA